MTSVTVRGDSTDDLGKALQIFKSKCKRSGIFDDLRKHTYYRKPSIKRREKRKRAAIVRAQENRKIGKRPGRAQRQP